MHDVRLRAARARGVSTATSRRANLGARRTSCTGRTSSPGREGMKHTGHKLSSRKHLQLRTQALAGDGEAASNLARLAGGAAPAPTHSQNVCQHVRRAEGFSIVRLLGGGKRQAAHVRAGEAADRTRRDIGCTSGAREPPRAQRARNRRLWTTPTWCAALPSRPAGRTRGSAACHFGAGSALSDGPLLLLPAPVRCGGAEVHLHWVHRQPPASVEAAQRRARGRREAHHAARAPLADASRRGGLRLKA